MLKYIKISKRPRILYRLTGLPREQFTALCTKLKPLWEKAEKKRLSQRERKRTLGQGRKYKLSAIEDKLLFILVFYRYYLTDELREWGNGGNGVRGNAGEWGHTLISD